MTNSNIEDKEDMPDRWLTPRDWEKYMRLSYIKSIQSHIPNKCPDCQSILETDEDIIYCPHCGLITQSSTTYVAGLKYRLPHGIKLMWIIEGFSEV